MLNSLQKELKKYGINLDEQTLSTALGVVVVLVIGVLAYGYFRANQPNSAASTQQSVEEGELGSSGSSVSLPATHTVVAGENLWTIAEKYYSSGYNFVDISSANNLANSNKLEVGQSLKIPKVEAKQATVEKAMTTEITLSQISGTQYTVAKGDFLWEISLRAYGDGYKWVEIAKANSLSNPNLIFAGTVLKLPR